MTGTHLARLDVRRAPGLPDGLPVLDLDPGLTVVLGPNASGKSTVARVLAQLLWPDRARTGHRAHAVLRVGDGAHDADLVAGRVTWDPEPPRVPPGGAELAVLSMRGLLDTDAGADGKIAREIARQLAGGLDLDAAARDLGEVRPLARNAGLAVDRRHATEALDAARREARGLAAAESELEQLEQDIAAARRAAADVAAGEALGDRLDAEAALAEARAALATFPEALADLRGDERDQLDVLDAGAATKRTERAAAADALARVVAHLDDDEGPLPGDEDLAAWATRIADLTEDQRRLGELELARDRAVAAATEARSVVLAEEGVGLDAAALDALGVRLQDRAAAVARVEGSHEVVRGWERWAGSTDGDADRTTGRAIDALRAWLRAGEVAGTPAGPDRTRAGLLLAALSSALVAVAGLLDAPALALAAGAGLVALLLVALAVRGRRDASGSPESSPESPDARARAAADLRLLAGDLELGPEPWDPTTVAASLDRLEDRRAEARLAERATDEAARAAEVLAEAEAAAARAGAALADQARAAGLDPGLAGLTLVEQAGALRRLREAEADLAAAEADRAAVAGRLAAGLADLAAAFAPFDHDPPTDAAAAGAIRDGLAARRDARLADGAERATLEARLASLDADLDLLDRQAAALWARAGLDPADPGSAAALDRLLDRREAYGLAAAAEAGAVTTLELQAQGVERHGLPSHLAGRDPGDVTRGELEQHLDRDRRTAEGLEELLERRTRIEQDLERAGGGSTWQDAIAAAEEAEDALAAERDRMAERAVGRLLLEDARRGQESDHAPQLLERARARFAEVTARRWRLELDPERRLAVRDTVDDQLLGLDQLSDGTRVQLLLVARLAALEEAEGPGGPLPIVLDEALATSDPLRFGALARVLFAEVDAGRQVLYLTADPAEAEQWRAAAREAGRDEPRRLDLGRAAAGGVDWTGDLPAAPAAPWEPPDPAGQDPGSYAALLGVPAPDGFAPVGSWHLFLAAHDDLVALAACLGRRIATLGHFAAAHADDGTGLDPDVAARFAARVALAEAFAPLWAVGRDRPLTWDVVEESGALSPSVEDGLRAAFAAHGRAPRAFLAATAEVPRFGAVRETKLRDALVEAGCLSDAPPLDPADLVRRALASAPAAVATLGAPAAGAYLDWLVALVGAPAIPGEA